MNRLPIMKRLAIEISKTIFYIYAFLWLARPRRARTIEDVYKLFYIDFLMLDERDVEIVKMREYELITRCRNPCPVLKLAQHLNLDTRFVCRVVSEPVCKYVLRRLNPSIVFERNYNYIRPYADGCEERIYIERQKNNR
ncbi:MAG: hypothetical protein N3D82_01465 [Ignisphaera sp.]|nr:hypothetical protein [Ignisphaera sp.]MCX8167686.1 hypothetical protein [Ignisphaera sp.]MDW8085676.1 hypothetical protein [Ignisphaera sp.]